MKIIKTPAIFVGHGSPMSVMPGDVYNKAWQALGEQLTKPKSILVISAHWNIKETAVSNISQPKQIYDFYGFPEELYNIKYEPPGAPELAEQIIKLLSDVVKVEINNEWGIDHGAWVPLKAMFPEADTPVLQLSIDYSKSPWFHYQIGEALRPLRERGVMIIGSGDMVHNLSNIEYEEAVEPFVWAKDFEAKVLQCIESRDHEKLINYSLLGDDAKSAIPTPEHYLPMLYILALQEEDDKLNYFVEGIAHGSISMTSFVLN